MRSHDKDPLYIAFLLFIYNFHSLEIIVTYIYMHEVHALV